MADTPLFQVPAKLPKSQIDGVLTLLPSKLIWTAEDPSQADPTEIDTHSITGLVSLMTPNLQLTPASSKDGKKQKANHC